MEDYEETEISGKSSKINSAMIVNMTLNELWKDSFRHFRDGKYLSWSNDLDTIWTILGGEPEIENSDTEKSYNDIITKLKNCGCLSNSIEVKGFNKVDSSCLNRLQNQKAILLKKALFLRRLQNRQGKGTAYHEADEDYMDS
jgi:hypothetical protein